MTVLVIASGNEGKVAEIKAVLADCPFEIRSLKDYQDVPAVVEDGDSFFANALKKARTVAELTGEMTLADDSGLEVDALDGAPGIYSARYAGENATDEENNRKLLSRLAAVPAGKRTATFKCVLVLYNPDGTYEYLEGDWRGLIHNEPAGDRGFGYDPVFFLPERGITVAQLPDDLKNSISHRGQALHKLRDRLKKYCSS